MKPVDLGQSTTFKYDAIFHKALGVWPDDNYFLARFSRIRGYAMAASTFVLCSFLFTELMGVKNTEDVPDAVIEGMASFVPIIKTLPIICYRDDFINLMRATKEFNEFSTLTDEEQTIHFDWQNIQDNTVKLLSRFYVTFIAALYFVAPMLRNTLPLRGIVPEISRVTPWFQIMYVLQCLLILSVLFSVVSSDCICVTFMCQLCKQLELVQCSIKDLDCYNKIKLASTINRHVATLDYGQRICNSLKAMFLLQHIFISMYLCFAGITILHTEHYLILVKVIVMSVLYVGTLMIICFVGEMITSASLNIASATQNSNYESFLDDISNLRAVSFILCRAQKPLRMTVAWQSSMNLSFFTDTINKLVSAFMILRTMME